MGLALISFLLIFILTGSAGLLVFYRSAVGRRLSNAVPSGSVDMKRSRRLNLAQATSSLTAGIQAFEKVLPRNDKEVSLVQKRLVRAGYRDESSVRIFYGAK